MSSFCLLNLKGFISIDCGMPEGYVEGNTYYSSDDTFVKTGINRNISAEYKTEDLDPRLAGLGSFPQGTRNCYTLRPEQGKNNTYLIRVWFWYGNYDGLKNPPKFDLYIGVNLLEELDLSRDKTAKMTEIMYVASTDCIHVCLLDKGEGTPFISALELRHLNGPIYKSETGCLAYYERNFMGSSDPPMVHNNQCSLLFDNLNSFFFFSRGGAWSLNCWVVLRPNAE